MVQTAVELLWSVLASWQTLWRWLWWLVVVGGSALLLTWLFRRPVYDFLVKRLRQLRPLATWGAALLSVGLCYSLLGSVGELVLRRVSASANASAGRTADPDAAPTTQAAPTVSYLTEKTYTRSLTIPPALLRTVKREGVQVLAPYLQDPTSQNIVSLRDRFLRNGQDIIFQRESTLLSEEPIKLDRSRMNVSLDFVSPMQGALRSYYNATFSAQYAFTNPLPTPVTARFAFPLPQGSGTLTDFLIVVDGKELTAADLMNGNGWQGEVQPRQTVNVAVTYRHQGARGWQYLLAGRREPIRNFALTVRTNQTPKFARYSLYPGRVSRTLGSTNLSWELKNVITAQDIALSFTASNLRETLTKLYTFAPLALLLSGIFGLAWARWRGLQATPLQATPLQVSLAALGVVMGTAFGGILMSYLPAYLAAPLGAAVALALALGSLGVRFWPPVLLAAVLPLAFLLVGHAGLVLAGVGVVVLALFIWTRPAPPKAAPPETLPPRDCGPIVR